VSSINEPDIYITINGFMGNKNNNLYYINIPSKPTFNETYNDSIISVYFHNLKGVPIN
jgi:hypothetical protein